MARGDEIPQELAMIEDVWHKDGPVAQIESMARWADRIGEDEASGHAETARKIASNLRGAVSALAASSEGGERENDRLLDQDAATYGVQFTDVTGKRVDPESVYATPPEEAGVARRVEELCEKWYQDAAHPDFTGPQRETIYGCIEELRALLNNQEGR